VTRRSLDTAASRKRMTEALGWVRAGSVTRHGDAAGTAQLMSQVS